jgi:hypothetical protein
MGRQMDFCWGQLCRFHDSTFDHDFSGEPIQWFSSFMVSWKLLIHNTLRLPVASIVVFVNHHCLREDGAGTWI